MATARVHVFNRNMLQDALELGNAAKMKAGIPRSERKVRVYFCMCRRRAQQFYCRQPFTCTYSSKGSVLYVKESGLILYL